MSGGVKAIEWKNGNGGLQTTREKLDDQGPEHSRWKRIYRGK